MKRKADDGITTVYVSNLNDKLNADVLKHNLYLLFASYGDVIDIVTNNKNPKMRGQAHIVYGDRDDAEAAVRACKGMEFFGKEMKVEFARVKSKVIEEADE